MSAVEEARVFLSEKAEHSSYGAEDDELVEASVFIPYTYGDLRALIHAHDALAAKLALIRETIGEVGEAHAGTVGTHYEKCYVYHAGCLAYRLEMSIA